MTIGNDLPNTGRELFYMTLCYLAVAAITIMVLAPNQVRTAGLAAIQLLKG